ncbi:MAG: 16S rRNA (guanine(966)-N(2))-methyltransferase RsmD [Chlamydiota bacterium]
MMRITGGRLSGRGVKTPKTGKTRPTQAVVREAIFQIAPVEGRHVLDLFAGSGIVGLEALSRGAARSTFVDQSSLCARTIAQNVELLCLQDAIRIYRKEVFSFLTTWKEQADFIYIDPPYALDSLEQKMERLVALLLDRGSLLSGGIVFLELPPHAFFTPPGRLRSKKRIYGNTVIWEMRL